MLPKCLVNDTGLVLWWFSANVSGFVLCSPSAMPTSSFRWKSTVPFIRFTFWNGRTLTNSCAKWANCTSASCSRPVWPNTLILWPIYLTSGASFDPVSSASLASSIEGTTLKTWAVSVVISTVLLSSIIRLLPTFFIQTMPYDPFLIFHLIVIDGVDDRLGA